MTFYRGVNNYGLGIIGSFVRGETPTYFQNMAFGNVGSPFDTTKINLDSEFFRSSITWSVINVYDARAQATIFSSEAVGSQTKEVGLSLGSYANGSDVGARIVIDTLTKTNYQDQVYTFDIVLESI